MTVKPKKYGRDQDYDGNKILNSSLNTKAVRMIIGDIDTDAGQIFAWELKARYDYTIVRMAMRTDTGSLTATLKINGVNVPGLVEVEATDSTTDNDTTDSIYRNVEIGDEVTLTIDSVTDSPTELTVNIEILQT